MGGVLPVQDVWKGVWVGWGGALFSPKREWHQKLDAVHTTLDALRRLEFQHPTLPTRCCHTPRERRGRLES
jgi:hypothetical protein